MGTLPGNMNQGSPLKEYIVHTASNSKVFEINTKDHYLADPLE